MKDAVLSPDYSIKILCTCVVCTACFGTIASDTNNGTLKDAVTIHKSCSTSHLACCCNVSQPLQSFHTLR